MTEPDEPPVDYRFTFANERTFLAWIRTALAFAAAAVAVVEVVTDPGSIDSRRIIGGLLAGLGLVISATAYARWAANDRAMRRRSALPRTPLLWITAVVLSVVGILVLVLLAPV